MSLTYSIECDRCGDTDECSSEDLEGFFESAMDFFEDRGWRAATDDDDDPEGHYCEHCLAEKDNDSADLYPALRCARCETAFTDVRIYSDAGYPFACPVCSHVVLAERNPLLLRKAVR